MAIGSPMLFLEARVYQLASRLLKSLAIDRVCCDILQVGTCM